MSAVDFPPPPTNPVIGQSFSAPDYTTWTWDGQKWTAIGGPGTGAGALYPDAPSDGFTYGRDSGDWNRVLPLNGGTMTGPLILYENPQQEYEAATKEYVDVTTSALVLYQGTWQVAANIPNIAMGAALDGSEYIAITANPSVPEQAPTNIPGIAGRTIYNGDRIIWASPLGIWQVVPGDSIDLAIAEGLFLQLTGGVLTGPVWFNNNTALNFWATTSAGGFATFNVDLTNNFNFNTSGSAGQPINVFQVLMNSDVSTLNFNTSVVFANNVSLTLGMAPVTYMQAATKGYVDSHIGAAMGVTTFIGTIDGSTGNCTYTVASGYANGPLISASTAPNTFVICDNAGIPPTGPAANIPLSVGDWLISDGVFWNHLAIGSAGIVAQDVLLSPPLMGYTDVYDALNFIMQGYLPLSGGILTGNLSINGNGLLVGGPIPSNLASPHLIGYNVSNLVLWLNAYADTSPSIGTYITSGGAAAIYVDNGGNFNFALVGPGNAGSQFNAWSTAFQMQVSGTMVFGAGEQISDPIWLNIGNGGYANIIYNVSGTRQWSAGCYNDGTFWIYDNSGNAGRMQFDFSPAINTWGYGIRYYWYAGNAISIMWDGSWCHFIVDGYDQGQTINATWVDDNFVSYWGANNGSSYYFGFVGSYGGINANGTLASNPTGRVMSINAYNNPSVSCWNTPYGCAGMFYDSSYRLGFGACDGGGNPQNYWALFDSSGDIFAMRGVYAQNDWGFGFYYQGSDRIFNFYPNYWWDFWGSGSDFGALEWNINGTGFFRMDTDGYGIGNLLGNFNAHGFATISDVRTKRNIRNWGAGRCIEHVRKMRPVSFERTGPGRGNGVGLVADEIEEFLPEAVTYLVRDKESEDKLKAIDQTVLIAVLIDAVKHLDARLQQLGG
jgi:hypothetical protein